MSDQSLQTSAAPFPPGPSSPVRRLLEAACVPPAPCTSAVVIELEGGVERSIARVNHGALSPDEVEAAGRALAQALPVVVDDEGAGAIVAVAAGDRTAVVCRLAAVPSDAQLERLQALAEGVRLATENDRLHRERHRTCVEHVAAEERLNRSAAYDLHDGATPKLLWARNALAGLARDAGRPAGDAAALDDLRATVASALDDVCAVMGSLDAASRVERSLRGLVADEIALLHRRGNVEVDTDLDDDLGAVDATVTVTAFRLVQEALTNAIRHGAAQRAHVRVRRVDDRLEVTVADDGSGFDPASLVPADPDRPHRLGLRGMRERVCVLAGTLHVTSQPGGPTIIHAVLPVAAASRPAGARRLP
jgi:signal transduction histidine kinase